MPTVLEKITERYLHLSGKLKINLAEIDREIMVAGQLLQECAELSADATNEEQIARRALDVISSEAAARLREPKEGMKEKSESRIASEVPMQEDVQAARAYYIETQHKSKICDALVYSMREKSGLVKKAADMIVAGYIQPASYIQRRPIINK
jgi:hypothetical protein